jgi:hypothetical protein
MIRKTLGDRRAGESARLIAAELAGESIVRDDHMAEALLTLVRNADEPSELRAMAAISLGPALEQAAMGFDDPDDVSITELMYRNIQGSLQKLYADTGIPKEVRRRILEASVRYPEPWHPDLVREAYATGDREWILTAVFAMRWIRGFDEQILEALHNPDPEMHYEAVMAAGERELDGAWPHVVELVRDPDTPKMLLLAAITAVGSIRPAEAGQVLVDLAESDDEDIVDAATEAISMAGAASDWDEDDEEDEDDQDEWVN